MQKKKIVVISLIATILIFISIVIINYNGNSSYTYEVDGIKYALKLDGESISSVPSKGLYRVDVTCENAKCYWDYDSWKLKMKNVKGEVKCDIDFVTITKNNLSDYLISLTGTKQGAGQVVNENGYRYEGLNPNNYLKFNNELWRIIGVFDENSHGQSDTNLVKIMRVNSIGGIVWDKSSSNNWETASLNSLLNGAYYNAQDGTNSGYCYIYSTSVPTNCDYQSKGIQDEYRSMIQNVTWYLGGYSSNTATTEDFYGYERGTTVYKKNPTSITGYIGLMYPSDYGYSVLASSCERTTNLDSYNNVSCGGQSWIAGNGIERFLTPRSANSFSVFYIKADSSLSNVSANEGQAIRPVLYLKENVYYIDGDGSIEDPIIIGE